MVSRAAANAAATSSIREELLATIARHAERGKPEPGQTQASADALERYMAASREAQTERTELARLRALVKAQQRRVLVAEALEREHDRAYLDTPYAA